MKKRKPKIKTIFIIIVIISVVCRNYFSACKIIAEKAKAQFESDSASAFYSALDYCIEKEKNFDELIRIEKNVDGDIAFVSTNALKLNEITRTTAKKSLENINENSGSVVKIPFGAYFGLKLFSGLGAETSVKLIKVNSVKCDFVNEFSSCGINRVIQRCYLTVRFDAKIVLPTKTEKVSAQLKMAIYENLIAGEVPKTFLGGVLAGYTINSDD